MGGTHHVTAMVVQAEAARDQAAAAPERLDEALTAVTGTGRAVADLRHLLDLLNPDRGEGSRTLPAGPAADAGGAEDRRAGQPVEFTEQGTPAAGAGSADLVAYRVVQAALTQAPKYAHGQATSVLVRHSSGGSILVAVGTDGPGTRAVASPGGGGRGLAGLRGGWTSSAGEFRRRARAPAGRSPYARGYRRGVGRGADATLA
ncbi:histidine kinase OS=Streptomyces albaduncus OX=68172 GN=FHS32_004749 PE=4 SV=1 [Streptomyces griseoloalbus]